MFLGQYRHNIDSKGRLTIPARFRELLSDGAYIAQGFEQNLIVLKTPTFEFISQKVNQLSMTDQTARELKRLLFSTAEYVTPDKNGRILIPQFLRDVAGLDHEAVVVGVGEYFELWSPEPWENELGKLHDTDANAQRFSALDLSAGQL